MSGNRRLYVSNGSGWYNVALVNATPTLTISPTGAIELSTEGTATTITLTGTDSDNAVDGLTFSVESDGSFAGLGTLSQDSSVFTITPLSEDSATTTASTLTFKASDGINFGSGTSVLSLTFKVVNSNYTTLLLQADSDGTDNQVDASTNSLTFTEYGNVTSTAFSPYHPGGYSNYMTGSGNGYVEWTSPPTFSATAWCVETWFKPDGMPTVNVGNTGHWSLFGCWTANTNNKEFLLLGGADGKLRFYYSFDGSAAAYVDTATGVLQANTWIHLAVSFDGTNYTVYADGVNVARHASSTQIANKTSPLAFGKSIDGSGVTQTYVDGWYADGRVINGSTLESNNTFPVPTSRIDTSVANTQAVFHNKPHVRQTVTYNGDATINRVGPYDYLPYTKTDYGGSVYFDGTGDYMSTPDGTYKDYGADDFTFECWIYPQSSNADRYFVSDYASSGHMTTQTFGVLIDDGILRSYIRVGGVNVIGGLDGSTTIKLNVWHHVALVRNGNTITMYLNGASEASTSVSGSVNDSTNPQVIGRAGSYVGNYFHGYMADVRFVKGTAVYTTNFAAPTEPLTAITNTQILTCTNKNYIWDAGEGKVITRHTTVASNTERKFATSSAMYFDGTAGLRYESGVDNTFYNFGTDDWTIEFWFRPNNGASTYTLLSMIKNNSGSLYNTPHIYMSSSNIYFYTDNSNRIIGGTPASNTWYHLAVTRSGNDHKMFLDGTQIGSTWTNAYTYAQGRLTLGNYYQSLNSLNGSNIFAGYMQNVRITKGLARYTAAFTPSTSEFEG